MAASKEERARQFLPFNALTGYYRMILERQRVSEPKKELSEDETEALSEKLKSLRRHDLISVTYYDKDAYITKTGLITDIDLMGNLIYVIANFIDFIGQFSYFFVIHINDITVSYRFYNKLPERFLPGCFKLLHN